MTNILAFFLACFFFLLYPSSAKADDPPTPNFYNFLASNQPVFESSNNGFFYINRNTDGFYGKSPKILCLYPLFDKYDYNGNLLTWGNVSLADSYYTAQFSDTRDVGIHYSTSSTCINIPAYEYQDGSQQDSSSDICDILSHNSSNPSSLDKFVSFFPPSPENMRLPTIISNLGGQGSLAGNLALELYTAIWQYLAIIVFIKFYKLIPGKMS